MPSSPATRKKTEPIATPSEKKKMALPLDTDASKGKLAIIFTLKTGKEILLRSGSNFDLCERKNIRDRVTREVTAGWEAFAYYSTLAHAMDGVMHQMLKASDAQSLAELQNEIVDIRKKLIELYEENIKA